MDAVVDALQNSELIDKVELLKKNYVILLQKSTELTAEERELAVKDLELDNFGALKGFDTVVGKRKKKMV